MRLPPILIFSVHIVRLLVTRSIEGLCNLWAWAGFKKEIESLKIHIKNYSLQISAWKRSCFPNSGSLIFQGSYKLLVYVQKCWIEVQQYHICSSSLVPYIWSHLGYSGPFVGYLRLPGSPDRALKSQELLGSTYSTSCKMNPGCSKSISWFDAF